MRTSNQECMVFNGVDGATGDYLLPPMTPEQISVLARGWAPRPEHLRELEWWHEVTSQPSWGFDGDPKDLSEAGWGVIFAGEANPAIKEALGPLLDLRREQATRAHEGYYREFVYRPGESKHDFLPRYGVAPGRLACPSKGVPYYLLIVGGADEIPFRFQYQLDVQYAVGRIAFDHPEDYARYAESVVRTEQNPDPQRKVTFFGVRSDHATKLSHDHLIQPLAETLAEACPEWEIETVLAEEATKARLRRLLGGEETPALLFTASHGIGFSKGHPRQRRCQGALLCQDWPGRGAGKPSSDVYFSADDLSDRGRPAGLVTFHHACYGAGTPHLDSFAHRAGARAELATKPFVARLPQRLLSHPRGGALAVIGHVDLTWSYSFLWPKAGEQLQVFDKTLERLLDGYPVGAAMEYFNQSYAELSASLADELEEIRFGKTPDDRLLTRLWTANNDARNLVVLGDPAVRLPASAGARPR